MGTHALSKVPGAPVTVSFVWIGSTVDAVGVGIPWTYRYRVKIQDTITGTLVGVEVVTNALTGQFLASNPATVVMVLSPSAVPGRYLSVFVILEAAESDGAGVPMSTWMMVDIEQHPNAIQVSGGVAIPAGTIGTVGVSQRDIPLDRVRGLFHDVLNG